jgi:signal peptidase II
MASWRDGRPAGPLSLLSLVTVTLVIVLDQASKLWVEAALPVGQTIDLLPILALLRVANTGIAFSLFAGGGLPLLALTVVITIAVIIFWITTGEGGRLATLGFALILGGAIGNLIDRVRLGYVVDFLWLHLGDRTLFVFNLADAALTLGPIILIATYLWPAAKPAGTV